MADEGKKIVCSVQNVKRGKCVSELSETVRSEWPQPPTAKLSVLGAAGTEKSLVIYSSAQ